MSQSQIKRKLERLRSSADLGESTLHPELELELELELDENLVIAQVMPQTLRAAWRAEIAPGLTAGEKARPAHGELVDTLGNLTLATYKLNAAMSNNSRTEKKDALKKKGGG